MMKMTLKDLLYVEDALSHEKFFKTQCQDAISKLEDNELKTCVSELMKKHEQIFKSFYGLL